MHFSYTTLFSICVLLREGFSCFLKYSNQIQKKATLRGTAALQREHPFQPADRAHQVNPLIAAVEEWYPAVVVYLPLKDFNLALSINHQLSPALLKAVAMTLCGASSFSLSGSNWDGVCAKVTWS